MAALFSRGSDHLKLSQPVKMEPCGFGTPDIVLPPLQHSCPQQLTRFPPMIPTSARLISPLSSGSWLGWTLSCNSNIVHHAKVTAGILRGIQLTNRLPLHNLPLMLKLTFETWAQSKIRECWTVAFGDCHSEEQRCVLAGYDNGDLKLFDLRTNTCPPLPTTTFHTPRGCFLINMSSEAYAIGLCPFC